ncbi:DUF5000 domain-containing lipoprotein [uncultured Proteiniphilum sp.]|uniref:DUF5000 domain-containing lipoprotein n=1 Tax=uncultured Proteiniphilum sp. TaxID=497637 RepID=UPI0026188FE3|nr:DUF5000 domain-containing lipoprotein [uncultured Proteiniphilum sp.]
MKLKKNCFIRLVLGMVFLYSCGNEEPVGQQPLDNIPPGIITNVSVKNIAGGAVFHYTLPSDEDLLYIKAVYSIDGETEVESKASAFVDSLSVLGFGDTIQYQVKLIAVDKSRNESDPHVETIRPLIPDVLSISKTLSIVSDFGGLLATWENPGRAEISVNIEIEDHNREYVPKEIFYSSSINGKGTVRGMDTIPFYFRTYLQDHWGNKSPFRYDTIIPIYETEFDKLKFAKVTTSGDIPPYNSDYDIHRIWDGNNGGDPCYSSPAGTGIWPQTVSFDLGVIGKISRLRLFQRTSNTNYIFHEGNLRNFEVWGCVNYNPAQSGWEQWTKLMDCESIKPSGLPLGQLSIEDEEQARNGEDFTNDPNNPPVRYIRILAKRTWANGANFQIGEVEIYGDNRPSVMQ